jgi:hypothetical protein
MTATLIPDFNPPDPRRITSTRWNRTLGMLFIRIAGFAILQAGIAVILNLSGQSTGWVGSTDWWPVAAVVVNVINITLLVRFFREEGDSYRRLLTFPRKTLGRDLLTVLAFTLLSGPISLLPASFFAKLIFGDAAVANGMMFKALPSWAAWLSLFAFPITIALAELPNYFGYVQPRLEQLTGKTGLAVLVSAFVLSAQHMTLPLIFDGRFLLWRLLSFLAFALAVGILLRWRQRLFPFMLIVHGLSDLATIWFVFSVSV